MSEHDSNARPISTVLCPTCQKTLEVRRIEDWPHFPFCSARCKLIDLGRWLGEDYRVPDADVPPRSDDPEP